MPRLKQYVFIPINLNTATDDGHPDDPGDWRRGCSASSRNTVPGRRKAQFDKEIGKYVTANPKELGRLWRYVVIQ